MSRSNAEKLPGSQSIHDIPGTWFCLFYLKAIDTVVSERNIVNETTPRVVIIFTDNFEAVMSLDNSKVVPVRVLVEAEELQIVDLVDSLIEDFL